MNFTKFLKSIFGDKSKRDMRLIQPLVEKVKEAYPDIEKLSNDEPPCQEQGDTEIRAGRCKALQGQDR